MPQNIPTDIWKNIKKIALESSLYAQVMRVRHKIMVRKKDTGKEPKIKYFFQGQSVILEHWLALHI